MRFWKTVKTLIFDHEAFRAARMKRNVSSLAVSRKAGLSASYVSEIERGTRTASEEIANKLINALKELS